MRYTVSVFSITKECLTVKKEIRLYNIFFPIWLILLFYPLCWLAVLPINFGVDLLVIILTLHALHADNIKIKAKKSILKVWLFGFLADIIGGVLLFSTQFIDMFLEKHAPAAEIWWYNNMVNSTMFNAFENVYAFLWVFLCTAVSGLLIYVFNYNLCLKKVITDPIERRKLALALAVFTAPYTFFIPTPMIG